jgi:hypothetical protein
VCSPKLGLQLLSGSKARRLGPGVERAGGKAGTALTQAREAAWQQGDDVKLAVVEGLLGGGTRARRGGEECGNRFGEDWAMASAFYRGWREVEAPWHLQWPAMKPPVTQSEDGGIYD